MANPKHRDNPLRRKARPSGGLAPDLPDMRWDKVRRVREALRRNTYDPDTLLDAAIESLGQELGILCPR